ncbi:tRNA (adenine(37)-N6)-methyltransferase isoform X2 [Venturia canescens]|uniref:tRNA (adenine(37)-N6)-methyltransferase isoform X2 n=1 Tax=Venturia canescens TaxID=32260 RepID=UPI001C9C39EE|nr:tRNA (adenine(37)-N6)-methyltransferase isoform X2 [Venturia canescens]
MDPNRRGPELDPKYLLNQLNTARKEINNLRQQVKSFRYILEKDVDGIKQAVRSYIDGKPVTIESSSLSTSAPSTSFDDDGMLKLKPIGLINTGFPSKRGTPRQPGICKTAPGKVTLFNSTFTNPEHALSGLQDFSHMWILFHFHRNDSTHVRAKVAPPRLNGVRTGVFSTRSPHRPCPIGLSLVKIVRIENNVIYFEGVDMVNETPVLDIKPYIPQYDNPLHIEKMLVRPNDETTNIREVSEVLHGNTSEEFAREEDLNDPTTSEQRLNPIFIDLNTNGDSRRAPRENCHAAGNGVETSRLPNISRDEEIAMRLQAEEFEGNPNFDDFRSRNYFGSNSTTEERTAENSSSREDTRDSETSRNSRLLDGADGPSTVCGTDLDLLNRRALNSRPDNSPIRMGVREAPDGEEGLESQTLTPSQTVANIHNLASLPSSNIQDIRMINSNLESLSRGVTNYRSDNFEVRVPDWISRPRTLSLSVTFNERALTQLNEILGDKADEQKRAIENVLREDPRSVYLRQRWGNQFYTFLIQDLHISCRFDDNRGVVTVFQVRHAGRTCECGEPEWQCLGHTPLS